MIHNLDKADNRFKDDENKEEGPWMHNAVPRQSLACSSQKILSTINPPSHDFLKSLKHRKDLKRHEFDTIIGAKMIRIQGGFWDPQHAVDYFKEHFPCAKYIVNSRDPMGILSSRSRLGWMNADLEHLESIKKEVQFLKRNATKMGTDRAVFLQMEKWVNDTSTLNEVIEWLGYDDCRLHHVQHQNFDGFGLDGSNPQVGECKLRASESHRDTID
ncbi:predicted protein [Chaetoceros tenuissimus]|uniref:Uncharacterized protein n=1 Tax=Chaetoceros tenuissimus TaxID=426638 RepID=A0AAD3CGQ8_9STRA|nr:predicted protein [Chaetoceros tenuissimus]